MSLINIIILAVVQGLAELLPVSSSAHVVVAEKLLGLDPVSYTHLNAAIVAELVSWGDAHLQAHGLGAYIAEATTAGDFHRICLLYTSRCV